MVLNGRHFAHTEYLVMLQTYNWISASLQSTEIQMLLNISQTVTPLHNKNDLVQNVNESLSL